MHGGDLATTLRYELLRSFAEHRFNVDAADEQALSEDIQALLINSLVNEIYQYEALPRDEGRPDGELGGELMRSRLRAYGRVLFFRMKWQGIQLPPRLFELKQYFHIHAPAWLQQATATFLATNRAIPEDELMDEFQRDGDQQIWAGVQAIVAYTNDPELGFDALAVADPPAGDDAQ